jgi:hypothetical protein
VARDGVLSAAEPYDAASDFYVRLMQRRGVDIQFFRATQPLDSAAVVVGCGQPVRKAFASLRETDRSGDCFALTAGR